MSAYNTLTKTTKLEGKGDYAILDGVEVKFVSDNLIIFELASDTENGREYTEINRVLHEGSLDLQKQESGEWKLHWGYSSARRRGAWSTRYRNVSDSVAHKLEKAIAAIVKEWLPHYTNEILEAGVLSAQRSIETHEYTKNKLLKQLQEVEKKIAAEEEALAELTEGIANFQAQIQPTQEVETSAESVEVVKAEEQPQPKRTTYTKAAKLFSIKGYQLIRNGRSFTTADKLKTFKRITDAIAWLNRQPTAA